MRLTASLFPVLRSVFDAQIALLKTTPVVVHSGLDFLKSVGVLSSSPDDPIPVVHSGTRTPVSLDRSVARPNDVVHAQTAVGSPGSKLTAASFKAPIDQIKEFIPRGKVPNDKPLTFKAPVDLASKTWALDFTTSGIQVPEEARASEAKAPEIKAHGIKASKDMVFELKTPETKAPEIKAPEMKAPEMKAPEFEAFDSRTSDKGKAEEISVDWENGNTARVVAASPADQGLPQASLATVSTAAVACGPPSDLDDALLLQTLATLSGDDSRIAFIKLWNEMKNRKSANQANRNMASSTDGPVKGGSGPSAAQSPRPVATTNGGGHGSKLAAAMPDKLDVKAQHPTPPVSPSVAAAPAAYAQRPGGFPIFDPCQVQW